VGPARAGRASPTLRPGRYKRLKGCGLRRFWFEDEPGLGEEGIDERGSRPGQRGSSSSRALFDNAAALYWHFTTPHQAGIGPAKIHKPLHVKRPWFYPVLDQLVRSCTARRPRHGSARSLAPGPGTL